MRAPPLLAALLLLLLPLTGAAPAADDGPVRIALLDSGILASHSEFRAGQVVAWRDFVNGRANPYDDHGHGTAVASRAAGRTIGPYPDAELIVGKVLDHNNALSSWAPTAQAIRWATDQDADIISISLWATGAQPTSHATLAPAIDYAVSRGVIVVWIAGNGGSAAISTPSTVLPGAASPQVIVVGSANEAGRRATTSQHDPELLGPGHQVAIAWNNGFIGSGSGTSYAAPWIAGAVARLIAEGAPRDPDWIEWVLLHSAHDDPAVLYAHEGYGFFGAAQLQGALAVARGDAPVPELDERDAFHLATTAPRVAQSATVPRGIAPPVGGV